jgi:hypothetical protein
MTDSLLLDSLLIIAATLLACAVVISIYLLGFNDGWKQHRRELKSLGREANRLNQVRP